MYQASEVEHLLLAIMGIRAHPRLATGQTSKGHYGTQSLGCAGQTVRPSLHSISQTRRERLFELIILVSEPLRQRSRIVSHCMRRDPRLIFATARENSPDDAGELVGERDCQHVAVEPLRCLLDPRP